MLCNGFPPCHTGGDSGIFLSLAVRSLGLLARVGRRAAGRSRFVPDHLTNPYTHGPRIAQCSAKANLHFFEYFSISCAYMQALRDALDVPLPDRPGPAVPKTGGP